MKEYILLDYENIQPKDLDLIKGEQYQVKVFLGANQSYVQRGVATALQALGAQGEYVSVEKPGKNAVDFHIAYYLGEIAGRGGEAKFFIVSKDTGFDPLVEHLKGRGIRVRRVEEISEITRAEAIKAPGTNGSIPIAEAIEHLKAMKKNKPQSWKSLFSNLASRFKLEEKEASKLVDDLFNRGAVSEVGGKLEYRFSEG